MIHEPQKIDPKPRRVAASRWAIPPKKHRQHHVWQHYLKPWCTDGQLHCLMDGRIFPTGTTAIAVEQHFYKIGKLTTDDIALIRFLLIDVKGLHPLIRRNHEDFLKLVTAPTQFEGQNTELDDIIDTFRTNALEDYHAGIRGILPALAGKRSEEGHRFLRRPGELHNVAPFLGHAAHADQGHQG